MSPNPTTDRSVFLEAIEIASSVEREEFVARACGDNAQLRADVQALLAAHGQSGDLLDAADQLSPTIDRPVAERPGTQIGPYKLIEQIGEGGMGTVWMAQQTEPVKRLVAVKVIKPGMDSRQVIARFEAERQALALMDHPNIARVLDAGTTEQSRPYFVMELVHGVPITKYCDDNRLTPRQRLELFIPVCQAIQHAHQKGIIHRDLKPSNVLVALYDGKPVPKVIDFGVAKAAGQPLTEQTLVTGFGNIVGTLEYMSPEQAETNQLDIDTRSDIYSLGVLLYELLTGSPPFTRKELEKAGMLEMLRVIREQEPSKPSTKLSTSEGLPTLAANRGTEPAKLTKLVRGELDWIVMKALEKDRSRRYETAKGLAMDIQRYLADEPVVACPPSAIYRFRKFARRYKGALAVALILAASLFVAVGGIGWAMRDRLAVQAEAKRERTERQSRATTQVELIVAEIDRLIKDYKWDEALASVMRAEAALATGDVDAATSRKVEIASRQLRFAQRLEQHRSLRFAFGEGSNTSIAAHEEYARAFRDFGVDIEHLPVETAISELRNNQSIGVAIAGALDDWAFVQRTFFGLEHTGWRSLVEISQALDGDPVRRQVRSIWMQPATPESKETIVRLAKDIDVRAQSPATLVLIAKSFAQKDPERLAFLRRAQLHHASDYYITALLAYCERGWGNSENGLRYAASAVSIHPQHGPSWYALGLSLDSLQHGEDALACFRMAAELDPQSAYAHYNIGIFHLEHGDPSDAILSFKRTLEFEPKDAGAHYTTGLALEKQGKLDEALAEHRKTLEIDPKYGMAYYKIGALLFQKSQFEEAGANYRKAIEISPEYGPTHYGLGLVANAQGKPEEALGHFHKAVELNPSVGDAVRQLVAVALKAGDHEAASSGLQRMLHSEPQNARVLNDLAWLQTTTSVKALRDPQNAVMLARRAVEIDTTRPEYWNTLSLAAFNSQWWCESLRARLEKIRRGPIDGCDQCFLAMTHWQLGDKDEAFRWYAEAKATAETSPNDARLAQLMKKADALLGAAVANHKAQK